MQRRSVPFIALCTTLAPAFLSTALARQAPAPPAPKPATMPAMAMPATPAAKTPPTKAQKIADAMRAAPPTISRHATIMDWPADMANGKPTQLRAGTNGWVCYPSMPADAGIPAGESPMCLDKEWQAWTEGLMTNTEPKITGTGIAYMLMGDAGASNLDPHAMAPTPTNQWVVTPPHVMIVYPDLKMLDAFPTDPATGGPWVMWKGTPYAHLMVPTSTAKAPTMPAPAAAK